MQVDTTSTSTTTTISATDSSLQQRIALALLAVLQNSLVGGLVYGWASIDRTLLVSDANLSYDQTTTIFSAAVFFGMFSSLLLGPVLDFYGPRKCSALSHLIVGMGCQIFAMANSFTGFLVGTIFITFGGPGIQLSLVHLCSLFPSNQYLALSAINGSISFSFSVFAAFAAIWESTEISFRTLFSLHAFIILLSMIASWFIWPDKPYELPETPKNDKKNCEPTLHEQLAEAALIHRNTLQQVVGMTDIHRHSLVEASTLHRHSLMAEQPLESFLRQGDKTILSRHHSFVESRKALAKGEELLVSLKDMPFWKQFTSGTYIRAVLIFLTTCFMANLYVASISTELADVQAFNSAGQHDLAQTFTLIMSGGVVASFLIGWLMDQVGLEVCTALTLILGQVQLFVLVWLAERRVYLVTSFVCYTLFRSFLFPVYIASITTHLGYKYFGLLNGVGFALSGVAQAFISNVVRAVQGTCHLQGHVKDVNLAPPCDHGNWVSLHMLQFIVLTVLLIAPALDYFESIMHKRRVREALGSLRSLSYQFSSNHDASYHDVQYGSIDSGDNSSDDPDGNGIGMNI